MQLVFNAFWTISNTSKGAQSWKKSSELISLKLLKNFFTSNFEINFEYNEEKESKNKIRAIKESIMNK